MQRRSRAQPRKRTAAARVEARRCSTNLLPERTSFVGRRSELARLSRLIAETRFVTLLGPAGSGKTRIAQQLGRLQVAERAMAGGIWFCDLTTARSTEDLVGAVS